MGAEVGAGRGKGRDRRQGLNAVSRRGIVPLLGELIRERSGMGLLLITHDLDRAAAPADRIAVLDGGAVIETGPAGRVLSAPEQPFTAELVAARWPGAAERLQPAGRRE
ncbi:hypothetical protein [Streptomyces sp. NPDC101393]|uniref:hypothetical protein n=1 Tax=Streptomyces sp. NPDC101393 TaxID=3366141 RepID=UPI003802846E